LEPLETQMKAVTSVKSLVVMVVIWVADRFLIAIEGSGNEIEMSDCTEAREALSFRRMERFAEKLQDM